jgi:hypothetical protein
MIFTIVSCSYSQDCKTVRNGKFKIDSEYGTSYITRDKNIQTERSDKHTVILDVEWINDCTYLLKNPRNEKGEIIKEAKGHILTVQISEIKDKTIRTITTANFSDSIIEAELEILD